MKTPNGPQRIVPYLSYADAPAAIEFLCRAFGFAERFRHPLPDGRLGHAELVYEGNVLMLASAWEGFGASPLHLPAIHAQLVVQLDDGAAIDAHHARALAGGATIVSEPHDDFGRRYYRAIDPEGHRWVFTT